MTIALHRFATAAVVLLAAGCASSTRMEKLYQDPGAREAQYGRILVIGVAGDPDSRRLVENLLAARLAAERVAATAGSTRLGASPILLQDQIDDAAVVTRSDAILIAHLVSVSAEGEFIEGRTDIKSECRGGNPIDYFLYDHKEIREPDSVAIAREVVLVTNLYDARTGARVWTVQSTCFKKSEFGDILASEVDAIVRQLRRDRLIRPVG